MVHILRFKQVQLTLCMFYICWLSGVNMTLSMSNKLTLIHDQADMCKYNVHLREKVAILRITAHFSIYTMSFIA